MSVRLAVVGATGAVGSLVLKLLAERNFPFSHLKLLASKNSVGKTITFRGQDYPVELLEPGAFRDVDIAIASTPDEVAAEFVPWAVEQGTVVVDESGYHRMRPDVPLVIGGRNGVNVNGTAQAKGSNTNIYSTEKSVNVGSTGRVLADKQVDINSGKGKPTQIDGYVASARGDVVELMLVTVRALT